MENPIRGGQKPCQNNYGRDRSIDIAKGIGIILVVYGHLVNPIHREIFLFHMPLFFLLSGYFFSTEKDWTTFIKDKIRKLIYPFCCFYFLSFLLRLCIEKGNLYESFCVGIYDEVSRQFISINTPLWFLLALFEIFIISFLTEKYVKKVWVKIIITGIITLIGYESAMHERYTIIPFLAQACMGYIFFRIGYWLKMKNTLKKKVSIFAISLLILGYGIGVTFNVTTDLFLLKMDSNYLLFFIPALCGSLLVIYLSKYLQNKRYTDWLSYLGKNSLLIMCVHSPLILLVSSILLPVLRGFYSFIGKTAITDEAITSGRICGFLSLIILVPLSLYIGLIVKKLFPFCFAGSSKTECKKAS